MQLPVLAMLHKRKNAAEAVLMLLQKKVVEPVLCFHLQCNGPMVMVGPNDL